jgi:hypothetical protein
VSNIKVLLADNIYCDNITIEERYFGFCMGGGYQVDKLTVINI